ncbi:MAG: type II toxin-antitoxin system YafQ family toxin [Firmicutes bacterium]|nr:type II toxin-antitoxin system YafQ family toxin [Bacillota bacterium]
MKYTIQRTSQFKKDFKLALKRNCDIKKLQYVITVLANGDTLPESYLDHPLRGDYSGYRECHVEPDWLLVYKITESVLILTLYRTGSHSDLF